MENVETVIEGLLELVRLDVQLRKTGKETAERGREQPFHAEERWAPWSE